MVVVVIYHQCGLVAKWEYNWGLDTLAILNSADAFRKFLLACQPHATFGPYPVLTTITYRLNWSVVINEFRTH